MRHFRFVQYQLPEFFRRLEKKIRVPSNQGAQGVVAPNHANGVPIADECYPLPIRLDLVRQYEHLGPFFFFSF